MISAEIAGINLKLYPADAVFFNRRFSAYKSSSTEHELLIRCEARENFTPYNGREFLRLSRSAVYKTGDMLTREIKSINRERIACTVAHNADYSYAEIVLPLEPELCDAGIINYEYMYTREVFQNRFALHHGGIFLHASSIAYRGGGIAFSANSGTGKSTHTALWKKIYGEDVIYINDDLPAIGFHSAGADIYGTPWSGKTDINNNIKAPLRAVVFLKQADTNRIRRLGAAEAMYNILSQTYRPYYDREVGLCVTEAAQRLVETTPVYLLECNVSEDAVRVVHDEIFKE
jgi:hypothetical protein